MRYSFADATGQQFQSALLQELQKVSQFYLEKAEALEASAEQEQNDAPVPQCSFHFYAGEVDKLYQG
jgi:hypothetical protein